MKIMLFYAMFWLSPVESNFGLSRTHQNKITVYCKTFSQLIYIVSQVTCATLLDWSKNILLRNRFISDGKLLYAQAVEALVNCYISILSPVESNFGLNRTHQHKSTVYSNNILQQSCKVLEVLST